MLETDSLPPLASGKICKCEIVFVFMDILNDLKQDSYCFKVGRDGVLERGRRFKNVLTEIAVDR